MLEQSIKMIVVIGLLIMVNVVKHQQCPFFLNFHLSTSTTIPSACYWDSTLVEWIPISYWYYFWLMNDFPFPNWDVKSLIWLVDCIVHSFLLVFSLILQSFSSFPPSLHYPTHHTTGKEETVWVAMTFPPPLPLYTPKGALIHETSHIPPLVPVPF